MPGDIEVAVISLASAGQRRSECAERFARCPYPWQFVDASTGSSPLLPYVEERARKVKGRALRQAEIGCFDSHIRVMAGFAHRNNKVLLVCEDDVLVDFSFDFPAVARAMHEADVHYVRLYSRSLPPHHKVGEWNERLIVRYIRGPYGTQSYLISPEGCRQVLARTTSIEHPIDDELDRHWRSGMPNYAVFPHPILEIDSPTTIEKPGIDVHGVDRALFRLRRALGAARAVAVEPRYRRRDRAFLNALQAQGKGGGGAS